MRSATVLARPSSVPIGRWREASEKSRHRLVSVHRPGTHELVVDGAVVKTGTYFELDYLSSNYRLAHIRLVGTH